MWPVLHDLKSFSLYRIKNQPQNIDSLTLLTQKFLCVELFHLIWNLQGFFFLLIWQRRIFCCRIICHSLKKIMLWDVNGSFVFGLREALFCISLILLLLGPHQEMQQEDTPVWVSHRFAGLWLLVKSAAQFFWLLNLEKWDTG